MVEPPHPGWTPEVKQPIPYEGEDWLQLDPQELGAGMYPFIISAVVPRPIAFISSLSKEVSLVGREQSSLASGAAKRP